MKLRAMSEGRWRIRETVGFLAGRHKRRGFTLIELIVVMGISAIIGAMGTSVGLGSAAKNICEAEFSLLYGVILRARNLVATATTTSTADEFAPGIKIVMIFDENKINIFAGDGNGHTLLGSFKLSVGFVATSSSDFFPENRVEFVKDGSGISSEDSFVGLSGPACNKEIKINHVGAII